MTTPLDSDRRRADDDGAPVKTRRSDADPTTTEVLLRQTWEVMREASGATARAAAAQELLVAELRASTAEGSLQRQAMARVVALGEGHLEQVKTREAAARGRTEKAAAATWGLIKGPLGYILAAGAIWLGAQYLGAPTAPVSAATTTSTMTSTTATTTP